MIVSVFVPFGFNGIFGIFGSVNIAFGIPVEPEHLQRIDRFASASEAVKTAPESPVKIARPGKSVPFRSVRNEISAFANIIILAIYGVFVFLSVGDDFQFVYHGSPFLLHAETDRITRFYNIFVVDDDFTVQSRRYAVFVGGNFQCITEIVF